MARGSAIRSFTLDLDALSWTGRDLQRPESVVAEPDGTLWASDGRGGVMRIDLDGGQELRPGWGGEPNGWPSILTATWSPPISPSGGCSG